MLTGWLSIKQVVSNEMFCNVWSSYGMAGQVDDSITKVMTDSSTQVLHVSKWKQIQH
jgi:hypothetical protein